MMNKKGQEKTIYTVFAIAFGVIGLVLLFTHGFTDSYKKITDFSKVQDTDGDGVADYLETMQGTCPCDKNTVNGEKSERYYLIKEDLYNDDIQPWDDKESGYLLGYYDGKLVNTRVLIKDSKPYLRLSESDVDILYSLFQKDGTQNTKLDQYNDDFKFVTFTQYAELRDLCIHTPTDSMTKCTYTKFVSDLLETENQKPTGCKTDPETCSKMREEKAAEEKSKK